MGNISQLCNKTFCTYQTRIIEIIYMYLCSKTYGLKGEIKYISDKCSLVYCKFTLI